MSSENSPFSNLVDLTRFAGSLPEITITNESGVAVSAKSPAFKEFNFLILPDSSQGWNEELSRLLANDGTRGLHSVWLSSNDPSFLRTAIPAFKAHGFSKCQPLVGTFASFESVRRPAALTLGSFRVVDCLDFVRTTRHLKQPHPRFSQFDAQELKLRARLSFIAPRHFRHFLGIQDDLVVACVTLFVHRSICGIYDLAVSERNSNLGIGSVLLGSALDMMNNGTCDTVIAQAVPSSLDYYLKLGFSIGQAIYMFGRDSD